MVAFSSDKEEKEFISLVSKLKKVVFKKGMVSSEILIEKLLNRTSANFSFHDFLPYYQHFYQMMMADFKRTRKNEWLKAEDIFVSYFVEQFFDEPRMTVYGNLAKILGRTKVAVSQRVGKLRKPEKPIEQKNNNIVPFPIQPSKSQDVFEELVSLKAQHILLQQKYQTIKNDVFNLKVENDALKTERALLKGTFNVMESRIENRDMEIYNLKNKIKVMGDIHISVTGENLEKKVTEKLTLKSKKVTRHKDGLVSVNQ